MGMSRSDVILKTIREFGEPMRLSEIAELIGVSYDSLTSEFTRLVRRGRLVRVSRGVYALPGNQTLSKALDIPAKKSVAPVIPSDHGVELTPQKGRSTVQSLLEAIASSDDPKRYAGVVQEIGKVLAS